MPLPCICINIGEIFEDENDTLEKYESTNNNKLDIEVVIPRYEKK